MDGKTLQHLDVLGSVLELAWYRVNPRPILLCVFQLARYKNPRTPAHVKMISTKRPPIEFMLEESLLDQTEGVNGQGLYAILEDIYVGPPNERLDQTLGVEIELISLSIKNQSADPSWHNGQCADWNGDAVTEGNDSVTVLPNPVTRRPRSNYAHTCVRLSGLCLLAQLANLHNCTSRERSKAAAICTQT